MLARAAGSGPGRITVFANPAYGFPVAAMAQSRAIGCPLGQAVRAFFAQGGRRCWVIRMGDPLPYRAPRADRWGQLAGLLARGYSQADTAAIMGGNWLRVIEKFCG